MSNDPVSEYRRLWTACGATGLYTSPWWLDLTCGPTGWTALLDTDPDNRRSVGLPVACQRISGMDAWVTPPLTQWVDMIGDPVSPKVFSDALLNRIPRLPIFDLQVSGIPVGAFAAHRVRAVLRYSYILPLEEGIQSARAGYNEGLRRNLREAAAAYAIARSEDADLLVKLVRRSLLRQRTGIPPWVEGVLPRVFRGLLAENRGDCLVARAGEQVLAAVLVAWDAKTTYYLAGGRADHPGSASAHALLLDAAVAEAATRGTAFDFEGSMHPGIANFFQSFGATPDPFLRLTRYAGRGKWWALFH